MTKNSKKLQQKKINIFYQTLQITVPKGLHKVKLQEQPSALKREHPALQNMNFSTFSIFVVIFALLDPDPAD
jgi:hypothetical protein